MKAASDGANFIRAIVEFFAYLAAAIWGIISSFCSTISAIGVIITFILITLAVMPWIFGHDVVIEEAEHFMRTAVFPFYRAVLRPILNYLRRIYNSVICWWNALQWWASGVITQAIYPTIVECADFDSLFIAVSDFVFAIIDDFLRNYFLELGFFSGPCDFTNICNKWIILWGHWTNLYRCACNDFGTILYDLPIVPSLPFSAQWGDPKTWGAIGNFINAIMEVLNVVLVLLQQLLQAILYLIDPQSPYAQLNFTRPDFSTAATLLCAALECAVRSFENAFQRCFDDFVPFEFDFVNYLSIVDTGGSIIIKTVNWLITLIVHIDRVVQYPTDPFWETTMKPLTLENLNLFAAPTQWATVYAPSSPAPLRFVMTNYYLGTNDSATPLGTYNPVYGHRRFSEAVCIFISRTICDPTNVDTPCFSTQASNLLQGFDFCCGTNALATTIVDIVSAVNEMSYHLVSGVGAEIIIFLDNQPFTGVFVDDLVSIASCIASVLNLIPEVGPSLKNLIVEAIHYVLAMIDFLYKSVMALATLPYFLFELPGTPDFASKPNIALDEFIAIQDRLIADTPTSFLNSLATILNKAFPIPPLPCTNCEPGGFIPLTKKKRGFYNEETGEMDSPWTLAAKSLGWRHDRNSSPVTPLIYYGNRRNDNNTNTSTHNNRNTTQQRFGFVNFVDTLQLAWINANSLKPGVLAGMDHQSVDRFVDAKKEALLKRWRADITCADLKREAADLRVSRPHLYRYHRINGKYDCFLNKKPKSKFDDTSSKFGDTSKVDDTSNSKRSIPRDTCSPTPQCFDLSCAPTATLRAAVQFLKTVARFTAGFVQSSAAVQGTTMDYPYFTGEFCDLGRDCFESDLVALLLDIFQIADCVCQFVSLLIDAIPDSPQEDICCAIQRLAEFVTSSVIVLINSINAIATSEYDYFTMGLFFSDIDALFDIALEFGICMCNITQAIFPLNFIPGLKQAISFDPCCVPKALFNAAVELIRIVVLSIISLGTLAVNPESYCFFRLDNDMTHSCGGTLDDIGFVQRIDTFIDMFFPRSDVINQASGYSCSITCSTDAYGAGDQGVGGIVPCICQLFNTLIPYRHNPDMEVSCNISAPNCQTINLCCPLVKLGIASNGISKFVLRAAVAIWQPWNGLPEFFVHFIFCDETVTHTCACGELCNENIAQIPRTPEQEAMSFSNNDVPTRWNRWTSSVSNNACAYDLNGDNIPACNCGTFTCGQLQPTIDALTNVINACLCEIVKLLDALLVMFFNSLGSSWTNCFCGQDGLLQSAGRVANVVLTTVIQSIRKAPLPCFWNPNGHSQLKLNGTAVSYGACSPGITAGCVCTWVKDPVDSIENSWIYTVLAPLAHELCQATGNIMCVFNSLFFLNPACGRLGQRFLGGLVRWGFEAVFRIASFIEGFVRQFTDPQPTCVGTNPTCNLDSTGQQTFNGVSSAPLARVLTSLLSYPIDMFLGDSRIACSRICPADVGFCDCWNLSPQTAAQDINGVPVFEQFGSYCQITRTPVYGAITHLAGLAGLFSSGVGVGAIFPQCIPIFRDGNGNYITGSCAQYNLCRPDSLPSCGSTSHTPEAMANTYSGPIDGILMGIIRYISCAINSPGTLQPLIWIVSYIWQLLGGFINFFVTLLLFLLSIIRLTSGCTCHEYVDPKQADAIVHFVRDNGALCYACPDAHAMCGPADVNNADAPFVCEPHCPVNQAGNVTERQIACVDMLVSYSDPALWTDGSNANTLCDGSYQFNYIVSQCGGSLAGSFYGGTTGAALQACIDRKNVDWILAERTQSSCASVHCQLGGAGVIPRLGFTRNSNTGRNQTPLVDCAISGLFDGIARLFNAYIAIFTQPFITPDAKRMWSSFDRDTFVGPIFRETRARFWERSGVTKKYEAEYKIPGMLFEHKVDLFKQQRNLTDADDMLQHDPPSWLKEILTYRQTLVGPMDDHLHTLIATQDRPPQDPGFMDPLTIAYRTRAEQLTYSGFDGQSPSAPEAIAIALWDYDTSDCFDDIPACVCRNFHMPEYCVWSPTFGTIPTPTRNRRHFERYEKKLRARALKKKREIDQTTTTITNTTTTTMYSNTTTTNTTPPSDDLLYDIFNTMSTEELMSILTERFNDSLTTCDHTVTSCADAMEYEDSLTYTTMESWVWCVDKRVQGERLSEVTQGVFEPNFTYRTQSPLDVIRKMMTRFKRNQLAHKKRVMATRMQHRDAQDKEFPRLNQILTERLTQGRAALEHVMGNDSPILDGILQMDQIRVKYQMGYYHSLFSRAFEAYESGAWHFLTMEEALLDLQESANNLRQVVLYQPYTAMVKEGVKSGRSLVEWISSDSSRKQQPLLRKPHPNPNPHEDARKKELQRVWDNMPLVNWWKRHTNSSASSMGILDRMNKAIQWRRQQNSVWSADIQLKKAVRDRITPRWTQHKLDNWAKVGRIVYRIQDMFSPVSPETRERFLLGEGGCKVLDRTLELTLNVIDYCANDWVTNLDFNRTVGRQVVRYLNETSPRRVGTFHSKRNLEQYELVVPKDPHAWKRYRHRDDLNASWKRTLFDHHHLKVDKRIYKRAIGASSGPAHFNFLGFLLDLADEISALAFKTHSNVWLEKLRAFVTNKNTEESDWPNVGLRYMFIFEARCLFPDNLDCSKGIGLGPALLWVTAGMILALVFGYYAFPPIMWLIQVVSAPLLWLLLVLGLGLHYPARCAMLTPSLTGIGVALPMCLMDEIVGLMDAFITNCPAHQFIPASMIAGDICPTDPSQYIDFINCAIVGVSDGVQHIIFLCVVLIGQTYIDFALMLSSTTIAHLIPGLDRYFQLTVNGFRTASATQREREWICFGLTFPALFGPLIVVSVVTALVGACLVWVILASLKAWGVVEASPISFTSLAFDDSTWGEPNIALDETIAPPEREEEQTIDDVNNYIDSVNAWLQR